MLCWGEPPRLCPSRTSLPGGRGVHSDRGRGVCGGCVCVKNISGGRQELFFRGKGGADLDSRDMDEVKRFCQRRLTEGTSRERSAGVGVVQAGAAPAGKRSLRLPHRKVELQTARSQVVAGIGGAADGGPWGAVCAWANVAGKPEGKRGGGPSLGAGPGRAKGPAAAALAAPRPRGGGAGTSPGHRSPPPPRLGRRRLPPLPAAAGGGAAPSERGSPAAGPAGAVPAVPTPLPARRARRGRAGRPGAGGDRRLLAAAVPPSPRAGPGPASASRRRGDAVGRCSGETPADPSPAPPETRGGRGGGVWWCLAGGWLAAPPALYCKTRWAARNANRCLAPGAPSPGPKRATRREGKPLPASVTRRPGDDGVEHELLPGRDGMEEKRAPD